MPNYTTQSQATMASTPDTLGIGARLGSAMGGLGSGIKREYDIAEAEKNRQKAADLIAEYGNPKSSIFDGLIGSQRTTKLVSLLQPLDPAQASRYEVRASEERSKDFGGDNEEDLPTGENNGTIEGVKKAIADIKNRLKESDDVSNDNTLPKSVNDNIAGSNDIEDIAGINNSDAVATEGSIGDTGHDGAEGVAGIPDETSNIVNDKSPIVKAPVITPTLDQQYGINTQLPYAKAPFASLPDVKPSLMKENGVPFNMEAKPTLLQQMGGTYGTGEEAPTLASTYGISSPNDYAKAPFIQPKVTAPTLATDTDIYGNGTLSGHPLTRKQLFDTSATMKLTPQQIASKKAQEQMLGYNGATLRGYAPNNEAENYGY